ncbi:hypothetical protein CBL_14353 [Carabus blaptoides fortunei]
MEKDSTHICIPVQINVARRTLAFLAPVHYHVHCGISHILFVWYNKLVLLKEMLLIGIVVPFDERLRTKLRHVEHNNTLPVPGLFVSGYMAVLPALWCLNISCLFIPILYPDA